MYHAVALQTDLTKVWAAAIVDYTAACAAAKTSDDAAVLRCLCEANYRLGIEYGLKMATMMVAIKCPVRLEPSQN